MYLSVVAAEWKNLAGGWRDNRKITMNNGLLCDVVLAASPHHQHVLISGGCRVEEPRRGLQKQ